ncbi:probable ADP-ribosylation factor GTPase-activating protein AGD14 [Salvia miltiorrhiza]|uniref:probable ADP-ribosylation factor GTPase-activating protein AGD14 n=1 Tax=Salvia miltiorrhiza TaxID=226208 RepID=UPI0025AB92BA|nr:probable ADP-ribosylation factor GTPase-activating protein AGD14 [Salvia miltiorrhiza]XP_057768109.1 probable ADP-ribosylation factor GTPase-activating protein AGD14 [Salvia miltiorrhiza]
MANRKEDEKNERTIRNLLKLPENRRCINCNSLGPQYVCTSFSTFVCTTCSGIHREFTHRVKSVSMAKFTPQEVSALQGGGNASGREIYLKEWDPQRNSLPDGSNVDRLRDFIKHVYVDRRYTGEKNVEKPPRAKMGETEDFNGNRRADNYQGSRSPPYDDSFDRRYGDRSSSGGRSPSYDQDNRQSGDFKKSPAKEVVNDWRREDRFGNGRRSDEGSKLEIRSPDHRKDSDISSPPVVRPVRDILGDNVSPLRVIEPPKATGGKPIDGRAPTQRTASSSSLASSDANPSESKVEASFIDFDAVPEPPTVTVQQSSSNDWANFDSLPDLKTTTPASNSVESLLSGLSVPASSSGPFAPPGTSSSFSSTGIQGSSFGPSFGDTAPPSGIPTGAASVSSFGSAPTHAPTGGQWPTMNPQQQPLFPGGIQQPVSGGSSINKSWNPLMQNAYGPPSASIAQVGQAEMAHAPAPVIGESTSDGKHSGRNALPEDLFSMNYSSYNPSPVPGWYPGAHYVARVPMHYNTPMAVANYQSMPTSINPFDVNEPSPVQASAFPSMASLQGALPKTATSSGLLHTPNYGASPYAPSMPSYAPTNPTSSFMGHEIAGGSMAPRPQGFPGFGLDDSAFASLNPNPQAGGLHAAAHPASSNFSTPSGNPFG